MNQLYRLILHQENQLYALQKAEGRAYPLQDGFLTTDLVQSHIKGTRTIGVRLLQPGSNTAKAGCIDIDCPRDAANLQEALALALRLKSVAKAQGLEAYVEFSGCRGFHVWLFSEQLLPGRTWIQALQNLATQAEFPAREVFPYGEISHRETKSIKLPCGIHRKSGKRSGFLSEEIEWADGFPIIPKDQSELMASMLQNSATAIAALASEVRVPHGSKGTPWKQVKTSFSDFPPGSHPTCIQYLLTHGSPKDQEYNATNLTLARYAITRGLADTEALALAEAVAEATPDSHPTSKDFSEKVRNFKSAQNSAKRNPEGYQWSCSYIWGSDELNRAKACTGAKCPAYRGEQDTSHKTGGDETKPLNRLIWQALTVLSETGREIRPSLILAGIERLDDSERPLWDATAADEAAEREILSFVLQKPADGLAEALMVDIPVAGFISTSDQDSAAYLKALEQEQPCNWETFKLHLNRVRDTGLRIQAQQQAQESSQAFNDRIQPIPETLDRLVTHSRNLLRKTSSQVQSMEAHTPALLEELFTKPKDAIETPSSWLNNALNGGWLPGRLYVVGAPPGAGKTTFCAWAADYAAKAGIPTLYVAYEMSRQQLWAYSLARLSGMNSALIESKRWNDPTYKGREDLLREVSKAAGCYGDEIAPHLTILEAGAEDTASRLKGTIAQVKHNAGLDKEAPALVIVDYLQLMLSGDEKLDSANAETLRVSRIATALKQVARDTGTAVIAISDITKQAYSEALKTGSLDMSALRDSFKIAHAADSIALLQTGKVSIKQGKDSITKDQLQLAADKYSPEKARLIDKARLNFSLKEASRDTYTRLSLLKNRGGMTAEPLFVYQKALHRFQPIDLNLGEVNDDTL